MSKNYTAICDLFAGVKITFPIDINWGESSDINIFNSDTSRTLLWVMPPKWSGSFPNNMNRLLKTFAITMYFYQPDKQDSNNDQRKKIIQNCDDIVTEWLLTLKDDLSGLDHDHELSGINVQAFYRQTVHILTGLQVDFILTIPDDFEYCE